MAMNFSDPAGSSLEKSREVMEWLSEMGIGFCGQGSPISSPKQLLPGRKMKAEETILAIPVIGRF